jgi:tRNA-2-methylthio-N6-dimethylallyladenosine synthase
VSEGLVQIRRVVSPAPNALKVYIETYGCQMNAADSDLMRGLLGDAGYAAVDAPDSADVILVNTCAVREKAEERVFARAAELKVWKKRRPGVVLGITGCMAEHLREKVLERAPHVDLVVGPDGYRRLPGLVARAREEDDPLVDVRLDKRETYEGIDPAPAGGVSAFITIQRGCDKFCTFCVVPLTRGRERATPPREVLRQVRTLVEGGAKEITLLGQTVNSYRHEEARFSDLLRAVAAVDGLERVRFTSPYPVDFSADVIAAIAEEPKIAKHVHMPLQSGSDDVLARMKRGYTYADFVSLAAALRQVPGIAITTDILVGFSGETDDDHRQTLAAMDELHFDHAFMFAYSEREGTAAARRLPDDIPEDLKRTRLEEVIRKQEGLSAAANAAYVGKIEDVLFHATSRRSDAELVGRTSSFKAVIVPRKDKAPGDLAKVRITRATSATLYGDLT